MPPSGSHTRARSTGAPGTVLTHGRLQPRPLVDCMSGVVGKWLTSTVSPAVPGLYLRQLSGPSSNGETSANGNRVLPCAARSRITPVSSYSARPPAAGAAASATNDSGWWLFQVVFPSTRVDSVYIRTSALLPVLLMRLMWNTARMTSVPMNAALSKSNRDR